MLFLVLLPQLLVLGLGHGIVVCAAPGGQGGLEVAGSACCSKQECAPANSKARIRLSDAAADCECCSELAIAVGSSRSSERNTQDVDPECAPVPSPVATHVLLGDVDPAQWFVPPIECQREPPHLVNLRSILLRC